MTDNTSGLTRRRTLLSLATIGAASITAGAGTMAVLSDSETAGNNPMREGTLDLVFDGSSSIGIQAELTPGQSVKGSVTLTNPASLTGSLDVDVDYVESDSDSTVTADDVASDLEVTTLTYGGTDLTGQFSDANGNGIKDLEDLSKNDQTSGESVANDLIGLTDPGVGTDFVVEITYTDPNSNNNSHSGNGIDVTVTFYLNQNDSQ